MSSNSSVGGMGAADRYCIWSSMSENADFSFSAFLISSDVTYGYSPYSRKLGCWCARTKATLSPSKSAASAGRASPSREMVLALGSALELPLRERNALLLAAGFAPVYRETRLDAPELEPSRRALDLILGDQIKLADSFYVFNTAMMWAESRPVVLGWVKEHFAELKTRMPDFLVARLSGVVEAICEKGERDDSARFFTEGLRATEGAERALAQALETADICIELRSREGARVKKRWGAKKAQ